MVDISFLEPEWSRYQALLSTAISSPYPLVCQINAHVTASSGKQIRPMLSLLCAKMFGHPTSLSVAVAVVVEMVHTATLLHDDVADQSDTRRGKPTVQKRYSPISSVLLGDFWLARAFQLMMDHKGEHLLCYFADAIREMSEGELFQIQKAAERQTTVEEYEQIIRKKTAVLMASGMTAGARSVAADEASCTLVAQIGLCLGMAFQIRDDIFDYSPQLDTGKPWGRDILEGKITLPLLGALVQASEKGRHQAEKWIGQLPDHPELLPCIFTFINQNQGIAYAQKAVEAKITTAKALLQQCPDTPARNQLALTIDALTGRQS
ncbi:MAG: polyprenyl synthetase family protein [Bacteroidetes bacterium]|nr:polyprenyl synthetase family protein [Bacteroidota bacterium]